MTTATGLATTAKIRCASLAAQARYLSDVAEIRALLARYTVLVDSRDSAAVAEGAFTTDGVDDHGIYGMVFRGREAIEAMFRRSNETTEASGHFIANALIDIDGDLAVGRTYVTGWTWVWAEGKDNVRPADWVFIGVYVDRFERTDEGWLISERLVERLGPDQGGTAAGARPQAYIEPTTRSALEELKEA